MYIYLTKLANTQCTYLNNSSVWIKTRQDTKKAVLYIAPNVLTI